MVKYQQRKIWNRLFSYQSSSSDKFHCKENWLHCWKPFFKDPKHIMSLVDSQIIFKTDQWFGTRIFLKRSLYTIRKICPIHWYPCLLPDQNNLNTFGRDSLKVHLYQIIVQPCLSFGIRRFFQVYTLYTCEENWASLQELYICQI